MVEFEPAGHVVVLGLALQSCSQFYLSVNTMLFLFHHSCPGKGPCVSRGHLSLVVLLVVECFGNISYLLVHWVVNLVSPTKAPGRARLFPF